MFFVSINKKEATISSLTIWNPRCISKEVALTGVTVKNIEKEDLPLIIWIFGVFVHWIRNGGGNPKRVNRRSLKTRLHLAFHIFHTLVTIIEATHWFLVVPIFSNYIPVLMLCPEVNWVFVISSIFLQNNWILEHVLKRWLIFSLCIPHKTLQALETMFRAFRKSKVLTLPWSKSYIKNLALIAASNFQRFFHPCQLYSAELHCLERCKLSNNTVTAGS